MEGWDAAHPLPKQDQQHSGTHQQSIPQFNPLLNECVRGKSTSPRRAVEDWPSQGRKHLPLTKNSHHPQLLSPLVLHLPWCIPSNPLHSWQTPGDGKGWQWGDALALGGTGGKPSSLKEFWAFLHLSWGEVSSSQEPELKPPCCPEDPSHA